MTTAPQPPLPAGDPRLISEGINTLISLGWASLAWLVVGAFLVSLLLLAVCGFCAWAVRSAWRTAVDRGPASVPEEGRR